LLGALLSAAPYDLLFASNGIEALDLMRARQPNLILMDMAMPALNGLETLRRLKDSPRFASPEIGIPYGHADFSILADQLVDGRFDLGAVGQTQHADGLFQPRDVNGKYLVDGEHECADTRNFN